MAKIDAVKLPRIVSFPPSDIGSHLSSDDWAACIDAWVSVCTVVLSLSDAKFESLIADDLPGVIGFIKSYVIEHCQSSSKPIAPSCPPATSLHKLVYLLSHRVLASASLAKHLLSCRFLADFASVYRSVCSLPNLLGKLWNTTSSSSALQNRLAEVKSEVIKLAETGSESDLESTLSGVLPLLYHSTQSASYFAIGSDLLDSLNSRFLDTSSNCQRTITAFVTVVLLSLIRLPQRNISLLSDQLYSLKTYSKASSLRSDHTLLSSIVSNTSLVQELSALSKFPLPSELDAPSGPLPPSSLITGLLDFRAQPTWMKKNKVKAGNNEAVEAIHIHRMSLTTQIQDLFPDYGTGFIAKLLDHYKESVEHITAHLLDESLPAHLAIADRLEQLEDNVGYSNQSIRPSNDHDQMHNANDAARRNLYDDDELDTLTVDASRLHIGKANKLSAIENVPFDTSRKAAIFAALAQFDSDDDERDDTYDAEDVGGTVDTSIDADRGDGQQSDNNPAERMLYQSWKTNKALFGRDQSTRKSQERAKLKTQIGWTDEAIEGWAIMLEREPIRQRQLERRYGEVWRGKQQSLERTAWQNAGNDMDSDGQDDGPNMEARREGIRGDVDRCRGRGQGRGRGRENTIGASSERTVQRARRGKEVRGNHARSRGRAEKMARGMG